MLQLTVKSKNKLIRRNLTKVTASDRIETDMIKRLSSIIKMTTLAAAIKTVIIVEMQIISKVATTSPITTKTKAIISSKIIIKIMAMKIGTIIITLSKGDSTTIITIIVNIMPKIKPTRTLATTTMVQTSFPLPMISNLARDRSASEPNT